METFSKDGVRLPVCDVDTLQAVSQHQSTAQLKMPFAADRLKQSFLTHS